MTKGYLDIHFQCCCSSCTVLVCLTRRLAQSENEKFLLVTASQEPVYFCITESESFKWFIVQVQSLFYALKLFRCVAAMEVYPRSTLRNGERACSIYTYKIMLHLECIRQSSHLLELSISRNYSLLIILMQFAEWLHIY